MDEEGNRLLSHQYRADSQRKIITRDATLGSLSQRLNRIDHKKQFILQVVFVYIQSSIYIFHSHQTKLINISMYQCK